MKKIILANIVNCLWVLTCPVSGAEDPVDTKSSRPNIVVILSDDMGWNDPCFNGGDPELISKLGS